MQNNEPDMGILKWIHDSAFVNEKGEQILFADHMFLLEPYDDFSPRQVYKKCSQVGVSVMMNFKCFYSMKQYGWNIIYTLPADSDVEEFVPTKTDKMIQSNPALQSKLQTDKVGLKQMYDRFLHFKGTRSKTAAIMTTADLLVHDEKDRSDQGILGDYRSRIKKSLYKGVWELSNPSVKNSGVDVTWQRSDRREWIVKCFTCNHEQVLDWHRTVDYVRKIYQCVNCNNELTADMIRLGRWLASNPDSEIHGYHISQMMAPWITAKELIAEEAETDEEYFYNFILGEPTGEGDAEDFRQLILDAWTPKNLSKAGPYFMGVDVGGTKHYVIGNKEGIFQIGKVRTRQELELLIEQYNPTVVMDAGPERTWAEEFRRKYPKLWLNFYKRDKDKKKVVRFAEGENTGIVYSDRSRIIDAVVTAIAYSDIQFDLDPKDLNSYILHWQTMVKKKEIDSLGLPKFLWDKNTEHAQDHWVHATVYYFIARSRGGNTEFVPSPTEAPKPLITTDGSEMRDLEEVMQEKEW